MHMFPQRTDRNLRRIVLNSLTRLDSWLQRNGWAGYDPYDILDTKFYLPLQDICRKSLLAVPLTKPLFLVKDLFPLSARKIFNVKKKINAKAMGLFARAYLKLGRVNKSYLGKALSCLTILMENRSSGYPRYCWGYPFNWHSRILIPKGTPSGVVTSIVGHSFLDSYEIFGNEMFLKIAESCCNFFLNDLNVDKIDKNKICFSYTPIDMFHVHNANLFCASLLLRTASFNNNRRFTNYAEKAIHFTMFHQRKDGSFYYFAPPDKVYGLLGPTIDNYHTGFILECLDVCRRYMDSFDYEEGIRRGLDYYMENLFLVDGTPRMTNRSTYPIDVHSGAQAISTFAHLWDFEPRCRNMAKKVSMWMISNMQDRDGHFYYRLYKKGIISYVDKTPYIRWGQAWMLHALSSLLLKLR